MSSVENRVVELEMRNSSLEKGAKESIKTLDKLDKALGLKNGKRSFEDVEKAAEKCNFEPLLKAADTVTERFSTLGIIGVRALERITDKAVDAGLALAKSLTIDQITAGYSKYEQKTANMQTLVNSTGKSLEEINGYLSKLMWFSDETSYDFADMTSALSTAASAGGDIDKLIPMIMGVANATAFAGKGASEFSTAMKFGVTQAYSMGTMLTKDWMSLENAGINSKQLIESLIAAGEELGTITEKGSITASNFRDSLSDKWLTKEVMEAGFGQFAIVSEEIYKGIQNGDFETYAEGLEAIGDQFGEIALKAAESSQEAKTYSEAISATKDAVSSAWMDIFESIFGNYNQQVELWTGLSESLFDIIVSPLKELGGIINAAFQETPVTKLADKLKEAEVDFDAFKQKVIEVGETFGFEFGEAADKAESFTDLLSLDGINTDIVTKALGYFSGAGDGLTSFVESEVNALELAKRLNKGEFGYGIEAMTKNLKAAGYDIESAQEIYNKSAHDSSATIKMVGETVTEVTGETAEALKEAIELAGDLSDEYYKSNSGWKIGWDAVRNVLGGIIDRIDMVKKAWGDVFPAPTATAIKDAIISFHKWSESLKMGDEEGNKITAVATKLFKVLKWGLGILGDVKDFGLTAIRLGNDLFKTILKTPVVQDFFSATSKAFDAGMSKIEYWMTDLKNWLDDAGDHLMALDWDSILDGLRPVGRLMKRLWGLLKKAGDAAVSFGESIIGYLTPIGAYIWNNMVVPFSDFMVSVIDSEDPIKTLKDGIVSLAKKAKDKIKSVIDAVKNGDLGTIFGDFTDKIAPILEKLDAVKEKIKGVIDNAKDMDGNIDMGKIISVVTLGVILVMLSKLSDVFNKISGAAGAVQSTFKSLNNIIDAKFGNSFATNAKAIAGAVVAIAASLYILSKIPKDQLLSVTLALGAIMVVFGVLAGVMMYATKKMGAVQVKKIETLTKPILALSAALLILCLAAKNASAAIGTEPTWKRVGTILALVGGLGLELVGLTWLMTLVSGKISIGAVLMMLVAVAVLKLAQAIKLLENLQLSADAKGIVGLIAIVAAIGLAMSLLGKISNGARFSTFANLGIGILAIVASLYLATKAIETISNTNFETTFGEFFWAFIGVAVGIGLAIAVIAVIGKKLASAAKSIALVSAGVLLMVGAVYLMTLVVDKLAAMADDGNTANAILGVVMIGAVIAAMTAALGYAASASNGGKGVIKIVAAVAGMVLIVGAMTLLLVALTAFVSEAATETIWKTIGIIAALAGLLSLMALAVGGAAKLGEGKGLGVLIGVIASMVVMVAVLIILTNFTWDQIWPALVAIGGCLGALGLTVWLLGEAVKAATSNAGGAAGLFAVVLILVAVAASLAVLSNYDLNSLGGAALAMSAVLVVLAFAMNMLGTAEFNLGATLAAVGIMIVIFVGLYCIIPQLEALTALDTNAFLINMVILVAAVGVLGLITVGLGKLLGSAPQALAAVALIVLVFLSIAAVVGVFAFAMNVLQGIDYATIANGLLTLTIPASGMAAAGIELIIGAVGVIAMASALVILGLAAALTVGSITSFNVALIALGNTLSAIGNAIQNSNGSIFGALANLRDEFSKSAEATSEAATKLWGSLAGGDAQNGVDTSAISPQLGEAFSGAVTSAGESASEEATTQGEKVGTNFADSIRKSITEGLGNKFALSTISGGVGFDLTSLFGGDGMEFSADGILGDIDLSSIGVDGGIDLGSGFTEGFGDSFDLSSMLGGDGFDLTSLLGGNKESTQEAGTETGAAFTQSVNESIESGAEEASNSMFVMLTNAVGMIDMESIGNIVSGNFMNSLGESFLSAAGVDSETLSGNFLPLIQGMVNNTDLSGCGEQMGSIIAESMAGSLESNTNKLEVSNAATSLGNEANEGAQQVDTTSSGSYWGQGFVNGMWSWAQRIWQTAYDIGQKAVEGVKAGTQEGSPCKTTIRSGKFFSEGLIVGIDLLGAKVQAAGYNMGMRAAMAVEDGIQNGNADGIVPVLDMSDVYNTLGDFDDTYRPVIKPTLDMSGMDPSFMNMQAVVSHKGYVASGSDTGDAAVSTPMSFNYTQNNYSPKALSRAEIYRQTKNQFSTVKGLFNK